MSFHLKLWKSPKEKLLKEICVSIGHLGPQPKISTSRRSMDGKIRKTIGLQGTCSTLRQPYLFCPRQSRILAFMSVSPSSWHRFYLSLARKLFRG